MSIPASKTRPLTCEAGFPDAFPQGLHKSTVTGQGTGSEAGAAVTSGDQE